MKKSNKKKMNYARISNPLEGIHLLNGMLVYAPLDEFFFDSQDFFLNQTSDIPKKKYKLSGKADPKRNTKIKESKKYFKNLSTN